MPGSTSSLDDLTPATVSPRRYRWVVLLILVILALVLIIVSIVRNELKVLELNKQQSSMLRRICEATVSDC